MTLRTIDVDQHLFESRHTWVDHIDPARRADALRIDDDEAGWPCSHGAIASSLPLRCRSRAVQRHRRRPPAPVCGGAGPAPSRNSCRDLWRRPAPAGRVGRVGLDAAVLFPNYGLLWEQMLAEDRGAQRANARAYNRFMADVCADGGGRLFGVATCCCTTGVGRRGDTAASAGPACAGHVAPAPVDGKPLSHPDFDPVWSAFCTEGWPRCSTCRGSRARCTRLA